MSNNNNEEEGIKFTIDLFLGKQHTPQEARELEERRRPSLKCPFCSFKNIYPQVLESHIKTQHPTIISAEKKKK